MLEAVVVRVDQARTLVCVSPASRTTCGRGGVSAGGGVISAVLSALFREVRVLAAGLTAVRHAPSLSSLPV